MIKSQSIIICEDDKTAIDFYNIYSAQFPYQKILYFPAHDSLPFSLESSSSDILLERSLKFIDLDKSEIIILTCNCFLKLFDLKTEVDHFLQIKINQKLDVNNLIKTLVNFGHSNNANVYNKLEFSLRGDILDIYNHNKNPYRISLFDNVVESIKEFNPQNQLTYKNEIEKILLVNPHIENNSTNHNSSNFISFLKDFSFFSYNRSDIVLSERLNFLKSIYNQTNIDQPFNDFYLDSIDIERITFKNFQTNNSEINLNDPQFTIDSLSNKNFKVYFHQGNYDTQYKKTFLQKSKEVPSYGSNFTFKDSVISRNIVLFNDIHINSYKPIPKGSIAKQVVNFNDLSLGDAVVHQKHGIGRFLAIDRLTINHQAKEFVRLIYRGNDKLLLPIENLNLISRYGFDDSGLLLDKLGSNDWGLRKKSVKKKIRFLANKLLKNAAKRQSIQTKPFDFSYSELEKFNNQFGYVETEDQLNAINTSLEDIQSDKPSNRLICGDVGFGKTEVALRIACATYLAGFQFVIVVPTTLLALQHARTFSNRFSIFNLKVETLSRFSTQKEKNQILKNLNTGETQILIATHSLFKKDIEFNNLGTLVIDEEQKFGVDQKEYLINKYPHIHLFSLSATPIPRTLQMSLLGLKDLSIIGTPPSNRISIRTYVQKYEPVSFLTAIKNEIARDGQIFIVVPRISHIPFVESEIQKLNLDISYAVGHSKMKEKDIEDVFLSFTNGEIQCLISTNIIESGIDIKNANTLIIFNSNLFGLSQLYQLRGRVGRSDKRAYAYLFHDSEKLINKTALKKLQVLANYENLGSNFQLANEDLEIRGAGNLLGDEQSGHVKDIGIELYQSMLKEEVEKQKNNKTSDEEDFADFEFNAYFEYYIPKNYIADDISRLIIYRKLTNAKNSTEIKDIIYEISDRYGNYPYEVTNLINLLQIKIKSINFGIIKINIQKNIIDLTFASVSEKLSLILINMVQDNFIKMKSQNSIQIRNTQNEDLFYSINLFYKKLGL